MKKIIYLSVALMLTGCFGPATFDSSTELTIKDSTKTIAAGLPKAQQEDFMGAIKYFAVGGSAGVQSMFKNAFAGKNIASLSSEEILTTNLQAINGLSGEAIIAKYKAALEQDRLKKEEERIIRDKAAAEREKVNTLKKEAKALLDDNQFKAALAKYNELSEVATGVTAAEQGIENTTKAMTEFTEKMNYIDKVEITEFTATRIDTYSKKAVPAVRVSLKNTGDRSLDKVGVVIYFNDKDGNTIFEKEYNLVLVSEYSYGKDNQPLKAGYVKEMEEGKYYTIDSPLTEWQEGNATIKVTDIRFSE